MTKVLAVMKISKFQKIESFGWTDATIVLQWLAQLPRTWTTFVVNRVSEILQTLPRSHWNHVRSTSNPADLSSRVSKFTDLKVSALWWNGPYWLAMPSYTWQKTPLVVDSSIRQKVTEEERNRKTREDNQPETVTTSLSTTVTQPIFNENVYSTLHKLFRVIATVKIAISRFKKDKIPSQITSQLLQQAKLHFLISHQTTHFHEEYSLLQAQKELPKTSKLLNFCPFFDTETDTIGVGGRLSQGNFLEEKKFPFLVKVNSNFASLILQQFHEATLHGEGQLTLNTSREEYWFPKGKSPVTKIIKNCVKCSRFSNETPTQVMADLPAERISKSRPFTNTGIDLARPLTTKSDNKTYIAVFVCFTTKATHSEIVQDLTKESCISARKRFLGRQGKPEKIFSDNGTNFVGARTIS